VIIIPKVTVDLLRLSDEIEPRLVLVIIEAAAQKYGTTTNEIHFQKSETIDSIWKEIYEEMKNRLLLARVFQQLTSNFETRRTG